MALPPMKAILVAGGKGSRLLPFTRFTHKTLLPLYRRPVIDYALGFIRRAGIKNITIIANQFIGQIAQHVGTGLSGEDINYVIEEEPKGVGHALQLARPHTKDARLLIYFSDNITTASFDAHLPRFRGEEKAPGCVLLGRRVENPESFGVGVFNEKEKLIDIIEKPDSPPSDIAIGGIYLYDERFWNFLDNEMGRQGDGFTISDLNRLYVRSGEAALLEIGTEQWLDCGTPDALLAAAELARDGVLDPTPCNMREGDLGPTIQPGEV